MATKLFVGSLPYKTTDDDLNDLFASFGTVVSAHVLMDRETGRSRGFGFIEMSDDTEAQAAIKELNGKDFEGRALIVNEARPQEKREGGRPFGGGGGGGNRDQGRRTDNFSRSY